MAKTLQKRARLTGWWKAIPVAGLPFALLFFEVWLRTQILAHEYQKNDLSSEIRTVNASIESLRDAGHELKRIERISSHAPNLGLVQPVPGQIVDVAVPSPTLPERAPEAKVALAESARSAGVVPTRVGNPISLDSAREHVTLEGLQD